MDNKSLLRQIQEGAADSAAPITDLLRQCKILSVRLAFPELEQWTKLELDGYANDEDLPSYRVVNVSSFGSFRNIAWHAEEFPIPMEMLPSDLREALEVSRLKKGIASFVHMLASHDQKSGKLIAHWPPAAIALLSGTVLEGMHCTLAWQTIQPYQIAQVIEDVRSRILDFALELERKHPELLERDMYSEPDNNALGRVFHTTIFGGNNNFAQASQHVQQLAMSTADRGDLKGLADVFRNLGLSEEEVVEGCEIVQHEAPKEDGTFGEKASGWFGKVMAKAGSGALKVGTTVASEIITKAICAYYGIHS